MASAPAGAVRYIRSTRTDLPCDPFTSRSLNNEGVETVCVLADSNRWKLAYNDEVTPSCRAAQAMAWPWFPVE